ncbi:protein MAINTENANCE OF MERISTEMS-like [Arachis ipaensis]|uniref:Aminotransferase-like plant mobile domain-containing protein n=1 Tax=Arachis hypogaea TaxID=3818 RepID=A0A444XGD7_ARAHY|nr:protein MAINTENANCE OF MERISTEMS-like [Arachis ipaensis]XP_025678182.1 protein MAINTENANCE OF MERISTEMS-like [Arachis hypogaea]RYQ88809.1 hypothetical protein Ahy_B09g095787 [Arachis hypogaea]
MARQVENDVDINRLNETTHYAGAADFEVSFVMVVKFNDVAIVRLVMKIWNRPRLLLPRRVSHTLPPPDAIVPYLVEAGFGDTVPLRNFIFDNSLISALVERWRPETHMFHLPWGEVVPYRDVGIGGAAPRCQASRGSTGGGIEEGVVHAEACVATGSCPPDAPDRGSRVLPTDFAECRAFFWGSAVLVWMYQSLSLAAQRDVTDINGCTPLLMSWIYQRFPQWCPPDRGVYQYPLATRLVRLPQQSRDQHEARVLRWRVSLDRLRFDEFAWKVYDDPALQALCPPWFREEEEWGTWLSAVPLLCFNIVRFHHVDRVKQQFIGE